jgi:hypothetical protein
MANNAAKMTKAGFILAGLSLAASVMPAHALVIHTTFDNTITSLAYAGQVESAFNAAASVYTSALTNPVTVNITVSWGQVAGQSLPGNAIGASADPLKTNVSYAQVYSALMANAATSPSVLSGYSIPSTSPTGTTGFDVSYANALALGMTVRGRNTVDGYIGFAGSASSYSFNQAAGIQSNTYDFTAVAAHEIGEVLGRGSNLNGTSPGVYMPFDLFRYSAPAQLIYSTTAPAYFSVDGGMTSLGAFNVSSQGGDRTDWAGISGDAQNAFVSPGAAEYVTAIDLLALSAIGWRLSPTASASIVDSLTPVPEPEPYAMLLAGLALVTAAASMGRKRDLSAITLQALR